MGPFSKPSWLILYCCIVFSRGNVIEGPGVPCYDERGQAQVCNINSVFFEYFYHEILIVSTVDKGDIGRFFNLFWMLRSEEAEI